MSFKLLKSIMLLAGMLFIVTGCNDHDDDGLDTRHLFIQTNEIENKVINYVRNDDGTLTERERILTAGSGTGTASPVNGSDNTADPLFSSNAVVLSDDHRLLFVANGGDNSVTSFRLNDDGNLEMKDNQLTGENGSAKSLAYDNENKVLHVLHSFGPNHLRSFQVNDDGGLSLMSATNTLNMGDLTDRIPTQITVSPNGDYLLANVLFDARPQAGADGPILTPSNTEDAPYGLVIFPIGDNGELGSATFNDAGAPTPFALRFLNNNSNRFVNVFAAGDAAGLYELGTDGTVTEISRASLPYPEGVENGPSELCWVTISPDDNYAYTASLGFGIVSSFSLTDNSISITQSEAATKESGDGIFTALAGIPTSAPAENWASDDGYFYQTYANADKLIAYKAEGETLTKLGEYPIPHNSPQGMAGF